MAQTMITNLPQYEYYYPVPYHSPSNGHFPESVIPAPQMAQNEYIYVDTYSDNTNIHTEYSSPEESYLQEEEPVTFYTEGGQYVFPDSGENQEMEMVVNEPQVYYVESFNNDVNELQDNVPVVEEEAVSNGVQKSPPTTPKKRSAVEVNCHVCGLFLKHPSKIQAHLRTHTGERPFQCEYCGKSFTQRTPWRCHVRRHLGDTPFQCSKCDKSFPNGSSRKAHEIRVHERNQRSGASHEFIGYASSQPAVVKDESKLSGYEPEFISQIINDVISGKVKIEDDEKFLSKPARMPTLEICPLCGLHLKYPSRIEQHMRSHSGLKPYLCEDCGHSFASSSTLKVHLARFHTMDRPHDCRWHCGKKFPAKSHRNEHEKIVHSKIKRYQCGVENCNKLFTRRLYLVKHLEKMHGSHPKQDEVKGFRVVAVPYETQDGEIKVPPNFDLSAAKIFSDSDGSPYIVDILGCIQDKLQRNPVLIEDALLQMLCNVSYSPQQHQSPTSSSAASCISFATEFTEEEDEEQMFNSDTNLQDGQ